MEQILFICHKVLPECYLLRGRLTFLLLMVMRNEKIKTRLNKDLNVLKRSFYNAQL